MDSEYILVKVAIEMLKISRTKMADLLESGDLPYRVDPLNKRAKYVRRADVERIKRESEELQSKAAA